MIPPPIEVSPADVLREQGADPQTVRARRPALWALAQRAVAEGEPLLQPWWVQRSLPVTTRRHQVVTLAGEHRLYSLRSPLVSRMLAGAGEAVLIACTIGPAVEALAAHSMDADIAFALALDAYASAAVGALGRALCANVQAEAAARGWSAGTPIGPGMRGWSLAEGQRDLFAILQPDPQRLRLTESSLMLPRKSTSLLIGIGAQVEAPGDPCQYCDLFETCAYKHDFNAHAKA
ncbi:MAG: hypothetical protein HPY76_01155 [Anaerolineae bacterium]|jgi:hypothetical protein|nr:hypothetical protein [Anaerolineae bacterium]